MQQSFESLTLEILHNLKHGLAEQRAGAAIPVWGGEKLIGRLRLVTSADVADDSLVGKFAAWREKHAYWFPAQFKVTHEGTRTWLQSGVVDNRDRMLFLLEDSTGSPVGHMGFYRFDFTRRICEADNIVRGEAAVPGMMTHALRAMLLWGLGNLQLRGYELQTYADNERAVALYGRCGFVPTRKTPCVKRQSGDRVEWVQAPEGATPERFNLRMEWLPSLFWRAEDSLGKAGGK